MKNEKTATGAKYSPLFTKILQARGIGLESAADFLQPVYEKLNAPDDLPDVAVAVARIWRAIKNNEKILVFGDYDADGITATAVLVRGLRHLGAKVVWDLPERTTDGYGLPMRILETMPKDVKLVITVDCGSRDLAVVQKLKEQGVDVIITDHHEVGQEKGADGVLRDVLPEAVAVVNPKRADSNYPFRDLAGVGVAFQLVRAVASDGWTKWLLDLVAVGTVCDQVPLLGDNRILVQYGLKVMPKTKWAGLQELTKDVKKLDAYALAFRVGPKINASGRLESPRLALELLLEDNKPRAAELAQKLNKLNDLRKKKQEKALAELEVTLGVKNGLTGVENDKILIVSGKWEEGLIGLIAGKLVEQYGKPAFVWTETSEKIKCSARSFGEFSCAEAIGRLRELGLIEKGGGHAAAGGASAPKANFAAIKKALNEYYDELGLQNQARFLREQADATVEDFAELDLALWQELQSLAPFGQGNAEPVLRLRGRLCEKRTMGKNNEHVCLMVAEKMRSANGERRQFSFCAWGGAKKWGTLACWGEAPEMGEYDFDFRAIYSDYGDEHLEGQVINITRASD
ncbi:MAG: single-stranded-DNA-specific exonuclease RecJ [Candidatus Nomurabacteria bacterium]|jgi:single-stranded-DNA-specific exonuclease|nr:single-stranded-DNA-specific exonuclease RecJ [Candidatus Nomurabacteria bacterium]